MKKVLSTVIIIVCFFFNAAHAQFLNDFNGRPITRKNYTDVVGTPFLKDDWSTGIVKLANGATYSTNLLIKYDLVSDELYFKGKSGEALAFVDPVSEFNINYSDTVAKHYKNGFKDIKGSTLATYFEVLGDGSVQLLKKTIKTILENKAFNSAVVERSFVDIVKYYLITGGKVIQVKNDEKSILSALPGKKQQITEFVKANAINFKSDTDLAKLVVYYNSL